MSLQKSKSVWIKFLKVFHLKNSFAFGFNRLSTFDVINEQKHKIKDNLYVLLGFNNVQNNILFKFCFFIYNCFKIALAAYISCLILMILMFSLGINIDFNNSIIKLIDFTVSIFIEILFISLIYIWLP